MTANSTPTAVVPFGTLRPGWIDRTVIAATSALPDNWVGLRLAILLRRIVTMRLAHAATPALDVTRWGLAMRLHPLDNGCEKNLLFTPNMYEPAELAELERAIREAPSSQGIPAPGAGPMTGSGRDASRNPNQRPFVFVDIGANVGLFSLFVAAKAPRARIVAIEPEPGNMARLTFNVGANGALPIRSLALALGDAEGEVAIVLNARDRGGTRARQVTDASADGLVRVPCKPLLSVLHAEGIAHIDALKIDVEGMEDTVLAPFLRDAPETLWPRMILIEDSRHEWRTDLFAVFAQKGYTVSSRSKQNVVLRR